MTGPGLQARIRLELEASPRPLWPAQIAKRLREPRAAVERALVYAAENGVLPLRLVRGEGYQLCASRADVEIALRDITLRVESLRRWSAALTRALDHWPTSTQPATPRQQQPLNF